MTNSLQTFKQRIVLVGGGHAHAVALRMFAMAPLRGADIVLISETSRSAYSGMLPGFVEGRHSEGEIYIDLRRLALASGAKFIQAKANGLNLDTKQIHFEDHPALAYDVLSLNVGSTPALDGVPGAATWAVPVKPIAPFLEHWTQLVGRVAAGAVGERILIVGGGAGGVELALAMHARLQGRAIITLVQASEHLLPTQAKSAGATLKRRLQARGIDLRLGWEITRVEPGQAFTSVGPTLAFTALYWVTNAAAPTWLKDTGLQLNARGFIRVGPSLECLGRTGVFAAGDCAAFDTAALPKAGVFAVRQGRPLTRNLRRLLEGKPLLPSSPHHGYLAIIGTADGSAVATRGQWSLSGRWIRGVKDYIDRRFIDRFTALPVSRPLSMAAVPPPPTPAMRCHGCGAKVSGAVLSQVLGQIERDYPATVSDKTLTWGLSAREDTSSFTVPASAQLLQSIDYFPALVDDPFLAGRLACIHAFSDILAKGARPHSAHVLAVLEQSTPRLTANILYQTLAGIATELIRFKAQLLGGHTAEGLQASIGLMVNGVAKSPPIPKTAGRPGDALVLTKPLGTGLIFAAATQGRCPSPLVDVALASMMQTQSELLPLLGHAAIHSATDITGFGLLGHLCEMLRDEAVAAVLTASAIPCLPGSRAFALAGIASSLFAENSRVLDAVEWPKDMDMRLAALWCDPQTCGGLLLSVDPTHAASLVANMAALGYQGATVIGHLKRRDTASAKITWTDAVNH